MAFYHVLASQHTLFVTASVSRQEEDGGAGEFQRPGLLGVQTLAVEVEPVRRVQSGHTPRQSHPLTTNTDRKEEVRDSLTRVTKSGVTLVKMLHNSLTVM